MNKNGSLNSGKRVDRSLALIASTFAGAYLKKSTGGKFTLDDFTMYPKPKTNTELSPESVFEHLSLIAKNNGN